MRNISSRRGLRLALVSGIGFVAAAGVAYATHTIATASANDPLVVCISEQRGMVRAVDDAADCTGNEIAEKLQRFQEPQFVTVDCAAGQTVADTLEQTASAPSVTITVQGTCTESVLIARDGVRLQGAAPGDGLAAPSAGTVLRLRGTRIFLGQLTLTGGSQGLTAFNGAEFSANGINVTGAAFTGINVGGNSIGNLNNSSVTGGNFGIDVGGGAFVNVNGGTVADSGTFGVHARNGASISLGGGAVVTGAGFHGAVADSGGSIDVQNATIQNSGGTGLFAFQGGAVAAFGGSVLQGNGQGGIGANAGAAQLSGGLVTGNSPMGALAYNGGALTIQDGAIVEDNNGSGVQLGVGSTLAVQQATIRDNTGHGIAANDTGVIGGQGNTITGNGGWGVWCQAAPAVAMISTGPGGLGDLSGNAAGDENCPNA